MSNPALSIVIPLYNRAALIGACLACLPERPEVEVIVVDDGSRDGSAAAAQAAISARRAEGWIRLLRQPNAGPGAARNPGAAAARAEWIAFLDCDDLWAPDALPLLLQAVLAAGPAAMIFPQTADCPEGASPALPRVSRRRTRRFENALFAVAALPQFRFASCNLLIRRDLFMQLGGFTTAVRCSEDSDLLLRASGAGPVLCLTGDWVVAHRVGAADSLSADAPRVAEGYHFMRARDAQGRYGPPDPLRRAFLARAAVYTIRIAFAQGHLRLAYGLWRREWRLIGRGQRHWRWRLPLTPVLSLLRPASYPMRWTLRRSG